MITFSRESLHGFFWTYELNMRKQYREFTSSLNTAAWASLPFPIVKIVPEEEVDVEDEILSFLELSENDNGLFLGKVETPKEMESKTSGFCRSPFGAISIRSHQRKGFLKFGKARSTASLPTTPSEPFLEGLNSILLSRSLGSTAKDNPSFVWRDLSFRRVALVVSRVVSTDESQRSKGEESSDSSMSFRSKFSGSYKARVRPPKKEFQLRKFKLHLNQGEPKLSRWWSASVSEVKGAFLSKAASGFGLGDQHARSACPGFDVVEVANCGGALDVHKSTHEQSPKDALWLSNAENCKRQYSYLKGVSGFKRAGSANCDVTICQTEKLRRLERENERLKKRVESLTKRRNVKLLPESASSSENRARNMLLSLFVEFPMGFFSKSKLKWKQMKWGLE